MRFVLITFGAAGILSAAIDFEKQVQPILTERCLACHSAHQAAGNVRLHSPDAARAAIVPGKPEDSQLYKVLELSAGSPKAMPPGQMLSNADRQVIREWVAEGAKWPAGVTLGPAAAGPKDERAAVDRLHQRITSATKEKTAADMKPYKVVTPNSDVTFEMLPIPGGEFTMGTAEGELDRRDDEGPQRKVKIDPFWMGKHEVTWDEYRLFMFSQLAKENVNKDELVDAVSRPTRPYVEMSFGMGIDGYPAISMTQHAANKYAEWLSAKTGQFYRLPTEAEWEYACRAGTTTAYSFGDDASKLGDYGWFADNSGGKYQKVGTKKPNPWGLFDMHGNVMEWTLDQHNPAGYAGLPNENPWNVSTNPYPQVVRGGSWLDTPDMLRCGARVGSDPSWKQQDPQLPKSIWYHTDAQGLGFRLVRPLKVPSAEEMFKYWNSGVEEEP